MCKQIRARPKNWPKKLFDQNRYPTSWNQRPNEDFNREHYQIICPDWNCETRTQWGEKKTKPQNYAASLGAVKMGNKIDTPPPVRSSRNLGVRIRGVPENTMGTPDERFQADIKAVEKILVFLNIDGKKLSKIQRIGRKDPDRTTPRTLIVNMENMLSKELVMKYAFRLKDYDLYFSFWPLLL